ncbi:MAG: hypothetical protein HKL80_03285 [Acidimicrobiales bacterium]|nr:hypothetical protein [Acidimicrobiales bacterium]
MAFKSTAMYLVIIPIILVLAKQFLVFRANHPYDDPKFKTLSNYDSKGNGFPSKRHGNAITSMFSFWVGEISNPADQGCYAVHLSWIPQWASYSVQQNGFNQFIGGATTVAVGAVLQGLFTAKEVADLILAQEVASILEDTGSSQTVANFFEESINHQTVQVGKRICGYTNYSEGEGSIISTTTFTSPRISGHGISLGVLRK